MDRERGIQSSDSHQYLTFELASEEYAIDILKVQEIRGFESTTRIPNTPKYLLGVINLRGAVVPIVDLRLRFGLPLPESDTTTVIILVKIQTRAGVRTLGMVVDAVSEVHAIRSESITQTPDIASNAIREYITGLATIEDRMIIILDIDALITEGVLEEHIDPVVAA